MRGTREAWPQGLVCSALLVQVPKGAEEGEHDQHTSSFSSSMSTKKENEKKKKKKKKRKKKKEKKEEEKKGKGKAQQQQQHRIANLENGGRAEEEQRAASLNREEPTMRNRNEIK